MSKKQALTLLLASLLLGFLMIQPFNFICRLTNKCQPIILSYYLPNSEGKQYYEIFFLAKDLSQKLHFESKTKSILIKSGAKGEAIYMIKNITNQDLKIRPSLFFNTQNAAQYIKFYECLCFHEYKIKGGETITLSVKFKLDQKIEKDASFEDNKIIALGYEVDDNNIR